MAGVKSGQAYSLKENKIWYQAMLEDIGLYKKQRTLQNKSESEKKNIPKEGLKVLKKIASEYKRSIRLTLQSPSTESLYKYSQYIIVKFYSEVALRNTLADVEIGKGDNHLTKKKGIYTIHLSKFKASDKVGSIEFPLSKALSSALRKYITFRGIVNPDHNYLLVNAKGGKLSKKGLGLILQKLTKKYTGSSFSTRIIRILKATANADIIEKALKVSKEMLHKDIKMTQSYIRKD